jgi:hypothetical protein
MDNGLDMIRQAEKEIQRDAEDLARLKLRYPGWDFVRVDTSPSPQVITRNPRAEVAQIERDILRAMHSSPESEWTSRSVVQRMRDDNLRLPERDDAAMNAVSYALMSLRDNQHITRIHEGRGRDPHRYKLVLEDKAETPA